jgi:putative transposase
MNHDPNRHCRSSIRLKGYDYSQAGAYFVTVCAQEKKCLFGDIVDGEMHLNDAGKMARDVWDDLSIRYLSIETDAFVVMPNHIHGVIVIVGAPLVGAHSSVDHDTKNRAGTRPAPTQETKTVQSYRPVPTLGNIVGTFKSITTRLYTEGCRQKNWPPFYGRLWQRNYYEHIIRSEEEMDRIRTYIIENPAKWAEDEDNPANMDKRVKSPDKEERVRVCKKLRRQGAQKMRNEAYLLGTSQ